MVYVSDNFDPYLYPYGCVMRVRRIRPDNLAHFAKYFLGTSNVVFFKDCENARKMFNKYCTKIAPITILNRLDYHLVVDTQDNVYLVLVNSKN